MSTPHERIRMLRALAESTTFPAEADAFRLKADELEAKYGAAPKAVDFDAWYQQMVANAHAHSEYNVQAETTFNGGGNYSSSYGTGNSAGMPGNVVWNWLLSDSA